MTGQSTEEMMEGLVREGWNWLVNTYQTEGFMGTLAVLLVGGVVFGGMGALFYAAAAANARGMKANDKKDS